MAIINYNENDHETLLAKEKEWLDIFKEKAKPDESAKDRIEKAVEEIFDESGYIRPNFTYLRSEKAFQEKHYQGRETINSEISDSLLRLSDVHVKDYFCSHPLFDLNINKNQVREYFPDIIDLLVKVSDNYNGHFYHIDKGANLCYPPNIFVYDCLNTLYIKSESLQRYIDLFKLGVFDMKCYKKQCFILLRPEVEYNKHFQAGNTTGLLKMRFSEKERIYKAGAEGMSIPEHIIDNPDKVTKEDITTQNAERRRIYREILGTEKFSNLFDLVDVDSDEDQYGNLQRLVRTKDPDNLTRNYMYFADVTCPSTGRRYYLCVPPMDNIWEAVAWTFEKDKDSYKPIEEA